MLIFKTFFKLLRSNLLISCIYIAVFLAISITIASQSAAENPFGITTLQVAVVDLEHSSASQELVDCIAQHHSVEPMEQDKDTMLDALYGQSADVILVIDPGYADALQAGTAQNLFHCYGCGSDYASTMFRMQLNQYAKAAAACLLGGSSPEDAFAMAAAAFDSTEHVSGVDFSETETSANSNASTVFFFQYLAYVVLCVVVITLGMTLMNMTQRSIDRRTNCSALPVRSRMTQIVLATVVCSFAFYLLLILVPSCFLSGFSLNDPNVWLAYLNVAAFLLFCTAFAVLIAVFSPPKGIINTVANVIGLGMSFLCGVFVPQDIMDPVVLNFAKLLPAYWYIKANNMIFQQGGAVFQQKHYLICIGIQFLFAIAMFCIAMLVSKLRQTSRSVAT